MSPSRIPRPQGSHTTPPSPLGPNAEAFRNANHPHPLPHAQQSVAHSQNAISGAGSPKTIQAGAFNHGNHGSPTSGFKPNPSFIQPRPNPVQSPPNGGPPRIPIPNNRSKRPKPPVAEEESPKRGGNVNVNVNVNSAGFGSPDGGASGIPRPSRGIGSPTVPPHNGMNPNPRSCLRQPSVPALSATSKAQDPVKRNRATSAAADIRPLISPPVTTLPSNTGVAHSPMGASPMPLFAPSFAESREPSVPPHIRVRLRLIHQLGVVLGIDAQGISSRIDVPGLLARVDAAYDRGYQGKMDRGGSGGSGVSMSSAGSVSSISGLPMPNRSPDPGQIAGRVIGKEREKDKEKGMFGMFRKFGREHKGKEEERVPLTFSNQTVEGPAFGVSLNDAPTGSWCTSLIGGQKHELPLVVFTIVEEIYRRGMSQPGIFRLAGDGTRISHLTKVFNLPPLYGDSLAIAHEPIHNLTGLVKRYIRDLPEPILDESLFPAFLTFCAEPEPGALVLPLATRISAAQILLKLLPPLHFSLLIYLLAFLGQLPLFPDNRLNVESISIIFGPAICAARGKGISGLGNGSGGKVTHDPEVVSNLVNQSQATLAWLLRNWAAISEKVLDPPFEEDLEAGEKKDREVSSAVDPRLLSPIDLRTAPGEGLNPFTRPRSQTTVSKPKPAAPPMQGRKSEDGTATTTSATEEGMTRSTSISPSPSSGSGIFARAFSSMNIAAEAKGSPEEKVPKRSASFTSLSSLVKRGGALIRSEPKSPGMSASRSSSRSIRHAAESPRVNPQISNVLGSLHDLLVSKDKQIERDARELALLRHTLLEMDEKLQRAPPPLSPCSCSSPSPTDVGTPPTPAITITSTPSTTTLLAKEKEISDAQLQLTTALAALETARLQSRREAEKTLELEAKLARADSEKRLEMSKLEVALALEQAKVVGLVEERDVARERLEKIKTTLFSVA